MTMEINQQEWKEFLEWCGFSFGEETSYAKYEDYRKHEVFYYPASTSSWEIYYLPGLDLNNLFRYAVPKLDYFFSIQFNETLWKDNKKRWRVLLVNKGFGKQKFESYGKDPALALNQAIQKTRRITNEQEH